MSDKKHMAAISTLSAELQQVKAENAALRAEIAAWCVRFPLHTYRSIDEVVSLRLTPDQVKEQR